ncbi:MAG: hybrid sensor histidine kinase/response regulator [Chloroflexi bacterium]|nr:hybrid sensor histidine kinase/response regulator [Chloroflexota bacterium]
MNNPYTETLENILIVDDIPANLRLLSQMLSEQGYSVRAVTNGPRALESVRAMPPDLILLDIKMPGMNGYQVCQRLKANEQACDIPIIFISALGETNDKINAFAVGGVDYITKPFQVEEVLARIETHLGLRDMQRQIQKINDELEKRLGELGCSNTELQARNEELDAFAHTVAHDLKNPLASLTLHTSWMKKSWRTMQSGEIQESLDVVANAGQKMTRIVDELLLLASIRREQVQTTPLDTASIVETVQERMSGMIKEHKAEIVLSPEQVWPVALGYAPWIEEVWINYISNAIKYGGQSPQINLGATSEADNIVRFWVRDNGPGLTPEQQYRLFVPFERLNEVRVQGYGLGLSIVRRILEKLGGEAGVTSEPDQGSTFFFTLPGGETSGE